jgi:glycerol-3-phosphate dehydrogenase
VPAPLATDRAALLAQLRHAADQARVWDLLVIGGGATGLGVALDAALRGFSVVLLEAQDFAQGTSSRATKLVHGGVRYLAQGDIGLVREALHERAAILANAPHLAQPLPFVMPSYRWWETGFYGAGLKAYDALAGRRGLGNTELLGARRVMHLLPGVNPRGLVGGVRYWDGQFDDARLALALARTAAARGALLINHLPVAALRHEGSGTSRRVCGAVARCADSGESFALAARCVINATGVWVDEVRTLDREPGSPARPPMVAPSQGVHLVVARRFLPSDHALLVPKTADGRVLFAVPWLGHLVLGTTDTPRDDAPREPRPFAEEVQFILRESASVLQTAPQRSDVLSAWVGLRPLVKPVGDDGEPTKGLSREHTVRTAKTGLVTVTGGKWTTYRAMAEDVIEEAMDQGLLPRRPGGATASLPLLGAAVGRPVSEAPGLHGYGSEASAVQALAGAQRWLWRADEAAATASTGPRGLNEAMVRFAVRHEYARSVQDVLARRCRLLFLDARRALATAPAVAKVLAEELGPGFDVTTSLREFAALAQRYTELPG